MVTIGWSIFLLVLIIGLPLGGISIGLLSGLTLGLLTFSVQPVAPPNDLMLLQATWLLLMATLEAAGLFYLLEIKFKAFIAQTNNYYVPFVAFVCYGLVFLTGDKKWLCRLACDKHSVNKKDNYRLLVAVGIAAHMALLTSPLSISGILLIITAGSRGLCVLDLVGTIAAITIGITIIASILSCLISNKCLKKLSTWVAEYAKDDNQVITISKDNAQLTFLLLLLTEALFLLIKPTVNSLTLLSCLEKIFPVRFPIFFALCLLSIAAVVMLAFKIKPANILQTHRFKVGIQQFFLFLGLSWLLDSLISHDKAYLLKILCDGKVNYGFYLLVVLYMLLIDMPIIIWLFSTLLIEGHCTILGLSIWLIIAHNLGPIRFCIKCMIQSYKKNSGI